MVADAVEVESNEVHCLYCKFVVDEGRNQGRRSGQVPGGHEHCVVRSGPCPCDVGCRIVHSRDAAENVGGGGDLPMKVVDGQIPELDVLRFGGVDCAGIRF